MCYVLRTCLPCKTNRPLIYPAQSQSLEDPNFCASRTRERDAARGMDTALEADAGSEDCAICFDPVHAEDRLPLPCRCQLTYCLLCWDRALAAAFNDNGQARCPSCRRPVRVDFVCHNRVRTPD